MPKPGGTMRAFSATSATETPPGAIGEKRLLYIRVCYPDDPVDPAPASTIVSLMEKASDVFKTNSAGRFSISTTVTELLTLPGVRGTYFMTNNGTFSSWNNSKLRADALATARKAGYDVDSFDIDIVRFNAPFLQSWAYVGARGIWMRTSDLRTTVHEIAHNLGLEHANAWRGEINGPGENQEYGNEYDLMGNPLSPYEAQFSVHDKQLLGWLPESSTVTATRSGIYRIHAADLPGPTAALGPLALRVQKDAERDYWVEKRSLLADTYLHVAAGVLLYWDPWSGSNKGTHLIDASPHAGESLPFGMRFEDPATGVRIIPVRQAVDHSWADVAVIFGGASLEALQIFASNEGPTLYFSGNPGAIPSLESSADLRNWSAVSGLHGENGDFFSWPQADGEKSQFFRQARL